MPLPYASIKRGNASFGKRMSGLVKEVPKEELAKEQPSRQSQHTTIARTAAAHQALRSAFNNGVSVHKMPQSVSFSSLKAIMNATSGQEQRTFVGTVDGGIVVSVNFNYESPKEPPQQSKGKRGRDSNDEAVQAAVDRVKKGLKGSDDVSDDMLHSAKAALYTMLTRLRGASNETAVESWGVSFKKPETGNGGVLQAAASRPRLILSVRLTPGVAVPLPSLFQCLGVRCTGDGMLTTQESSSLASGFNLPLGEAARAAESHGQKAITLFATVSRA